MSMNKLFTDAQHGFVPGRSCSTQLLTQLEDWTGYLDNGNPVDVVYLDFKKAFDSVPHVRLKNKVASYGISGPLLSWIQDFLSQRVQRVTVDGCYSEWTEVISGIPQGSVLGPTLFVMFVNDIPDITTSHTQLYADDAKVYSPIQCQTSCHQLQRDLDSISAWSSKWQLPLNSQKCKTLHLGYNNPQQTYVMEGRPLEKVDAERDLGVLIDKDLTFRKHIAAMIQKANQMLGIIKRAFVNTNQDIFIPLYKTLVRPHLEYCTVSWNPRFMADDRKIEAVQRRATRMIPGMSSFSYPERLKKLNLFSLRYRRERADMIQVYKILHGIDRLSPEHFFKRPEYHSTRGHPLKLFNTHRRLNVRGCFFSKRVIELWNKLPEPLVTARNIGIFKTGLDKHWLVKQFHIT